MFYNPQAEREKARSKYKKKYGGQENSTSNRWNRSGYQTVQGDRDVSWYDSVDNVHGTPPPNKDRDINIDKIYNIGVHDVNVNLLQDGNVNDDNGDHDDDDDQQQQKQQKGNK
eukprot:378153_1